MSLPLFCQGLIHTSWCSNESADLDGNNSIQTLHLFTVVSMSLFIPGQNTVCWACLLHFSIPQWPAWIFCKISAWRFFEITIQSPNMINPFNIVKLLWCSQYGATMREHWFLAIGQPSLMYSQTSVNILSLLASFTILSIIWLLAGKLLIMPFTCAIISLSIVISVSEGDKQDLLL